MGLIMYIVKINKKRKILYRYNKNYNLSEISNFDEILFVSP